MATLSGSKAPPVNPLDFFEEAKPREARSAEEIAAGWDVMYQKAKAKRDGKSG